MIKILGSIFIIISSTVIGFYLSDKLKKRVEQLKELERCIYILKNEIIFAYTSLPEAFKYISNNSKEPFKNIFYNAYRLLSNNYSQSVYEAFLKTIKENENNLYLNNEDKEIILNFSKTIGIGDMEGQKNIFNLTIENLKKQIEEAEIKKEKNLKIYRYLGFGVGTCIVIMLI